MPEQSDTKIKELEDRLDELLRIHTDFQKEIHAMRGEIVRLRAKGVVSEEDRTTRALYAPIQRNAEPPPIESRPAGPAPPVVSPPNQTQNLPPSQSARPTQPPASQPPRPPVRPTPESSGYELPKRTAYVADPVLSSSTTSSDAFSRFVSHYTDKARENLEEFVGKNLISLIGIVVLILGVGIGAKYAIDNGLISPLTRIIVGYVFGFGLVGLAIKLKRNYHNFSAVLISGGMAIMYFVTYFAYSAYGLIGQLPTFGLMIMFTVCTVTAALKYNRQVIAHIGLVGAYAVPFLLSTDSGNYLALFIYMAVINTGILAISVKKDWKPIFYTSSVFTWAIFCGWYATKYSEEHFKLALIFLTVFFVIFYAAKLAQARSLGDSDPSENTISRILTTGVFYAMCFAMTVGTNNEAPRYWILFTYLATASALIVAAALRFHREPFTFYAVWLATWVIFCGWFATYYSHDTYFNLALIFLGVFFVMFYATWLVRQMLFKDDEDTAANVAIALLNGFVFYAMCFGILFNASSTSGTYWTFLTYIAVASAAMLATSFKFFGRVFLYLVVPATWMIYGAWFGMNYDATQHFQIAAIFAGLYFALFYFSILFHRLAEKNFTVVEHTSLILGNAFTFYGFGYALFSRDAELDPYLGLYTAASALLHLIVLFLVRTFSRSAVDVVQVLTILVLTLASIAVPVQFDGNVVTMVWAAEAAVLFGYGRMRAVRLFESYSYPVMILAVASLFLDWSVSYSDRISGVAGPLTPVANADFITALVFVAAFGFIYVTNRNSRFEPAIKEELVRPFGIMLSVVGTFVLYNLFRIEIGNYFFSLSVNAQSGGLAAPTRPIGDAETFNIAWQINYTLFFLICVAGFNLKKLRSITLTIANSILGVLALGLFSTASMFLFYLLRRAFVTGTYKPDVIAHWMYIGIRPISYVVAGSLLYMLYEYCRDPLLKDRVETSVLRYAYDALAYTVVFIAASCELVNLMGQLGLPDGTKLGLSILWGVYALTMVVIGIAKDKKHLRIAAMVLLAVTLAKLFFYDIAELDTISKTILFVTLGITLLVVSFLYNKYKDVIFKAGVAQED